MCSVGATSILRRSVPRKDHQLLRGRQIRAARLHRVASDELKSAVDLQVGFQDAGFFGQFAQRALQIGLAGIDVAFRQVEAVCVFHQQKRFDRLVAKDQKTARSQFVRRLCADRSVLQITPAVESPPETTDSNGRRCACWSTSVWSRRVKTPAARRLRGCR